MKPEGTQAATTESLKQAQATLCFWAKQLEIDKSITFWGAPIWRPLCRLGTDARRDFLVSRPIYLFALLCTLH
jgi:hypothetical protein